MRQQRAIGRLTGTHRSARIFSEEPEQTSVSPGSAAGRRGDIGQTTADPRGDTRDADSVAPDTSGTGGHETNNVNNLTKESPCEVGGSLVVKRGLTRSHL